MSYQLLGSLFKCLPDGIIQAIHEGPILMLTRSLSYLSVKASLQTSPVNSSFLLAANKDCGPL